MECELTRVSDALIDLHSISQLQEVAGINTVDDIDLPQSNRRRSWIDFIEEQCLAADDPVTACKLAALEAKRQKMEMEDVRVEEWWAGVVAGETEAEELPNWSWDGDNFFTKKFKWLVADCASSQNADLFSTQSTEGEDGADFIEALRTPVQCACTQNALACSQFLSLSHETRNAIAGSFVELLFDTELKQRRSELILDSKMKGTVFASVWEDMPLKDRLWVLLCSHVTPILERLDFTGDKFGLLTCMALLKASTEHTPKLEDGMCSFMNGALGRFQFEAAQQSHEKVHTLVITFSSMGNGLVRHEFRGSLQAVCPWADQLYVLDPAYSWYTQDPECNWQGASYYEARLREYIERGGYQRILMLGDSMGGSGALLFSHLATSVVAFSPQVDLVGYPMATREDLTGERQQGFTSQLLANVRLCLAQQGRVSVHVGDYYEDITTLRSMSVAHWSSTVPVEDLQCAHPGSTSCPRVTDGVHVTVHPYRDHLVTTHLKSKGELVPLLCKEIPNNSS